jgi:hypothetical protein
VPAHTAKVAGTLSDAAPDSLRSSAVVVAFTSARGSGQFVLRATAHGGPAGTSYGPVVVSWDGPTTIDGQVFALEIERPSRAMSPTSIGDAGTPPITARLAHRAAVLTDGQTLTVDLSLERVANVRRPAGRVLAPNHLVPVTIEEEYRSKDSGRLFPVGGSSTGREYEVPDLRPFGLAPCSIADGHSPYLNARATQCAMPLEEPAVLTLPQTPAFSAPASKTPGRVGLVFSWSEVPRAVYRLTLRPTTQRLASPTHPVIQIYTSVTTDAWPDLRTVGLVFPKPLVAYEALIAALGPYGSVDEAAGPDGVAALAPRESWRSESYPISVPILPPLGAEEAACHYEEGQVVVCGPPPRPGLPSEWYQISAMNNLIRYYPDFANAIGIHCVLDCAGARAFGEAYSRYSAAHPGFDENTPLEVGPPPPPPPMP